jgi:hypothetical protein
VLHNGLQYQMPCPHIWKHIYIVGRRPTGCSPHLRAKKWSELFLWNVERVRGAERLQDKGRGQPGGNKRRKKVPAVRQSLFGHLERSNLLRDGDKPGNFFSEVSESVFPVKRKENPPARQSRPSWPSRSRSTQCESCQATTVWRGEESKGQRDHQEFCSVNRVRRRL